MQLCCKCSCFLVLAPQPKLGKSSASETHCIIAHWRVSFPVKQETLCTVRGRILDKMVHKPKKEIDAAKTEREEGGTFAVEVMRTGNLVLKHFMLQTHTHAPCTKLEKVFHWPCSIVFKLPLEIKHWPSSAQDPPDTVSTAYNLHNNNLNTPQLVRILADGSDINMRLYYLVLLLEFYGPVCTQCLKTL